MRSKVRGSMLHAGGLGVLSQEIFDLLMQSDSKALSLQAKCSPMCILEELFFTFTQGISTITIS